MTMKYSIERDLERTSYLETIWKGQELIETRLSKAIQFYKVRIDTTDKNFEFVIRKDDAGNIIIDSDDKLTEFLYENGLKGTEINELIERITLTIHTDFYKDSTGTEN